MELNDFPLVRMKSGRLAYGGDQEWFGRWRQRLAGCAPVSGANLAAYYELGIRPDGGMSDGRRVYTFDSFLDKMNVLWGYMTPGFNGFPYMWKYIEKFRQFAADNGAQAESSNFNGWHSPGEAVSFVRGALEEGNPAVMLVLSHKAPEMKENTWHWMTVTGLDDERNRVIISNYGSRETYDADRLFEVDPHNDVNLTYFRIKR
jgi:hypothetical protein